MSNFIWWAGVFVALGLLIVLPRAAWYALMSYSNRVRYAKAARLAASQGLPPPDPPAPPDLWGVTYRINRIAAVLGLAGALIAVVVLFLGSHR